MIRVLRALGHRRDVAIGAVAIVIGAAMTSVGPPAAANATTVAATPVILNGEGSSDIYQEDATDWPNDLYGSSGLLTDNYTPLSGELGRQALVAGQADYAISGVPFTASDLQGVSGGASAFIAAPVMPSAVGFMFQPPQGDFHVFHDGKTTQTYDGPFNVPWPNLTAMMLEWSGIDPASGAAQDIYSEWDDPPITDAWPGLQLDAAAGDSLTTNNFISVPPTQFERSEPSESTYYMQQAMVAEAPQVWAGALQSFEDPTVPTQSQVTETLPPYVPVAVRQGVQLQVQALLNNQGSSSGNGTLADVPPSAMAQVDQFNQAEVKKGFPATEVQWIGVPNAQGQYVTPNPASIDASIDAGGTTPLYGLTHDVPGGYPLTYLDYLYAPAHGLSQPKTEALATLIRYLVTDGQKYNASFNDGQLSPSLVQQALGAANQLVDSNCKGSGEEIVTSTDPGPYAPDLPGIQGIGKMDNCLPTSAAPATTKPTTTTTTVAKHHKATTTTVATPRTTPTSTPSAVSPVVTQPTSTSTPTTVSSASPAPSQGSSRSTGGATAPVTTGPSKPVFRLSSAVTGSGDLEIHSGGGGGFDHLAALLLGAGLFLLLRRPGRWIVRSATA